MNRTNQLIQGALITGLMAVSMTAAAGPYVNSPLNSDLKVQEQVSSAEMSRAIARKANADAAAEATRSILLDTKTDLEIRLKDHTSETVASL